MPEKKSGDEEGRGGAFCGEAVIAEFEALSRDAAAVQRETLRRILAENAAAEYLRGRGLDGRTDPDSFRACVPLATHADVEPYIARIADGDASAVLTAGPITSISLSSGTTQGKRKYLPFNQELVKSTMQIYRTSYAFRNRAFPVEDGKALQFIYGSQEFTTKGGLTATTATTNVYRSDEFMPTMLLYCFREEKNAENFMKTTLELLATNPSISVSVNYGLGVEVADHPIIC